MKTSDPRSDVHLFIDLWLLGSTVMYSLHWVPLFPLGFVANVHAPVVLILGTVAFAVLAHPEMGARRNLPTTFGFACLALVLFVLSTVGYGLVPILIHEWGILPSAVVMAPGFALFFGVAASTYVLLRVITPRSAIRLGVRVVLSVPLVVLVWRLLFGPGGDFDAWTLGFPVLDGLAYATVYLTAEWVKRVLKRSSVWQRCPEEGDCRAAATSASSRRPESTTDKPALHRSR